jgi:hypothetical protein
VTDRTVERDTGSTSSAGGTSSETGSGDTRSLGEIVGSITTDISTLVRQEMDLAKTELKQEMGKAGKGAGLLGGAGLGGFFVLLFASLTGVFALDLALPLWASALIVTGVWVVIAAVLALVGRKALQESNPQLPQTQQTLQEDASWARAQKS